MSHMGPNNSIESMANAVETLGRDLKVWNKHTFGNVDVQIKRAT